MLPAASWPAMVQLTIFTSGIFAISRTADRLAVSLIDSDTTFVNGEDPVSVLIVPSALMNLPAWLSQSPDWM